MGIFDKDYYFTEKVFDTATRERYNDKNNKPLYKCCDRAIADVFQPKPRLRQPNIHRKGVHHYEVYRDHTKGRRFGKNRPAH